MNVHDFPLRGIKLRGPSAIAEPLLRKRGVGPGIGVFNFSGDRRRGRGSFGRGKVWDFPL